MLMRMKISGLAVGGVAMAVVWLAGAVSLGAADVAVPAKEAVKRFKLENGLRLELAAAEPQIASPVAVAWDESGKMLVAENRGYPTGPGEGKPPVGVLAQLEDVDGDGYYERRTVFADGLTYPNGLQRWSGGWIVTCAPDVLYFKDTNGDGKADVREVWLTGFGTNQTTQLRVSHPTLGPDGWIYLTSGLTGGEITSPKNKALKPVKFTKNDTRFHPRTFEFEVLGGTGQYGMTFDAFGRRFTTSNRNPLQQVVLEPRHLKRNPHYAFSEMVQDVAPFGDAGRVHPLSADSTTASFMPSLMSAPHAGSFTSACGSHIFYGSALTPKHVGDVFVCEPAQNLVQRQVLVMNGSTFRSEPADPKADFLATADSWFRPVYATTGPEGALYICDMYRRVVDHPQYLPENIRKTADFESGKDMGRIYRVVGAEVPAKELAEKRLPNLAKLSADEAMRKLMATNGWVREVARRRLIEDPNGMSRTEMQRLARARGNEYGAAAAVSASFATRPRDENFMRSLLGSSSPDIRELGLIIAERSYTESQFLVEVISRSADDSDARVRFQCALTLGEGKDERIVPPLLRIALRDGGDKWTRAAVLSSIGERADDLFKGLVEEGNRGTAVDPVLMQSMGQILAASQIPERMIYLLTLVNPEAEPEWPLAFLSGVANGLRGKVKGTASSPVLNLVAMETSYSAEAATVVKGLFERALKTVQNAEAGDAQRIAAIGLLAQADYAQAGEILLGLIGPKQAGELQIAAIRSLGAMNEAKVGESLLTRERWRAYSPPVREAVVATVMSQVRFLPALLDAIEAGHVQAWSLTPARRTQLTKHKDDKIRTRAEALFQNSSSGDRMKVYEEYKAVLAMKANAANGHEVFKKACASCHKLGSDGANVGPDLTGVKNQTSEVLLLHILVPEYEIYPGYISYDVETKDGTSITGLLASETASSVTLKRALGQEDTILRANIASMASTSLSLMPQELEKTMTKQELADLIGFLKGN
jgi:putative membrane-bound dehydrogenase-like protein